MLFPGIQGFFNICKSISVVHYISKLKDKKHDHLNRCRESLWQNSMPIYDKNSPESRNRRNIPQHNKSYIWKTHSKHYPQWWKIESISPKVRNKTRMPLLPLLFSILLEVLATAIREKKKIKGIQIAKEEVKLSLFADEMVLYIENPFSNLKLWSNYPIIPSHAFMISLFSIKLWFIWTLSR